MYVKDSLMAGVHFGFASPDWRNTPKPQNEKTPFAKNTDFTHRTWIVGPLTHLVDASPGPWRHPGTATR